MEVYDICQRRCVCVCAGVGGGGGAPLAKLFKDQ